MPPSRDNNVKKPLASHPDRRATVPTPASHKLHSTKPIERLNGEIKRRMTEVVGIHPNEDGIVGLVGANQLEQNDESWKSSSSEDSLPA